jgi:hypothetical protein
MLQRQAGQKAKGLIPIPAAGSSETVTLDKSDIGLEKITQYLVLRSTRKEQ